MAISHVTPRDAHTKQGEGYTYLDVRSSREFAAGHPDNAVNIPLLEHDDSGQLAQNPDFIRVVQANFPADAKLLVGCQAGARSMKAAQMLESFGYTNLTNVLGGFGGARDPQTGFVTEQGWHALDLPVEEGAPEGRSYSAMLEKADRADD